MKKLIFAAMILVAASAQAEMVSIKSSKCSLFGNLKIKVRGLESFGRVGKGYLKANLPMSADCDAVQANFNQTMGRGAAQTAVDFDQYEVQRQVNRGGNDRKREEMCEVYKRSVLKASFPKYGSTVFKNTHEKLVYTYYGNCR